MNILLIEDDKGISSALKQALANTYSLDAVSEGAKGLTQAATGKYQLIILDLFLPDIHGLEICRQLRSNGFSSPILILTADAAILHKITMLDTGANDYLTKPFSLGELKARIRVLSRQITIDQPVPQYLRVDDLVLDSLTHQVRRAGVLVPLRRKEFSMLECLLQNAGTVVTRQALMHYAWHGNHDPWTNTIDVHIKYLRDKIDRPFGKPLIKTVHGLGYKIEPPQTRSLEVINEQATDSKPVLLNSD